MTEGRKGNEEEREDSKKKGKRHEKKVKEEGNATHGIKFWRLVAHLLPSSGAIQHPKWIQKYASNACCARPGDGFGDGPCDGCCRIEKMSNCPG